VDVVAVVLIALALAAAVAFVGAPLRLRAGETDPGSDVAARETSLADLEAAKEAKYREIRDAEMDFRTGKLSQADYEAVNATLRAEAIEILARLNERGAG
jgi:hypothetical protein